MVDIIFISEHFGVWKRSCIPSGKTSVKLGTALNPGSLYSAYIQGEDSGLIDLPEKFYRKNEK